RPMLDMNLKDIALYQNQLVYASDKAIISNAWAGKLYSLHTMPNVTHLCGGNDFSFLLTDGTTIQYITDSKLLSALQSDDKVIDILFDKKRSLFWLLSEHSIKVFDAKDKSLQTKFNGDGLTSFALANNNNELIVGTHDGYLKINAITGKQIGTTYNKLPSTDITVVKEIGNNLWFGTANGAFMLQADGKYKYYASRRWIPANNVKDIAEGSNGSVLILTDKGLGEIHFEPLTLYEKAVYFEKQVRQRHIRLGFNATISGMKDGDVNTGSLEDSDNDGLWTS